MNLLHSVERRKQIGLVSSRSRTSDVNARHGTPFGEDHRAARGSPGFGVVTDLDALDICETTRIGRRCSEHWERTQSTGERSDSGCV